MERTILDKLLLDVRHFSNRDFLKAAMAVCALVAAADDEVTPSEHRRIEQALKTEPALKELETEKAIDTLYQYIYALRSGQPAAAEVLSNKVARLAGSRKRARTLMRLAYLVMLADGVVRDKERAEFRRLCHLLDLEPQDVWRELAADD